MWRGAKMRSCRNFGNGIPLACGDDESEQDVRGVAVVIRGARREVQRVGAMHELEHVIVVELRGLRVGNEVLVVDEPGRVREQMADPHIVRVRRSAREHVDETIVVMELSVLHEQHDRHRGERLRERGEPVVGVDRRRRMRLEIGAAEGAMVHLLSMTQHHHTGTR